MFQIDKIDFHRYLKSSGAEYCTFHYYANGNDPCNPCGTVCKQAKYEFYVIVKGESPKLIVWKNHRRSHDIVEEQLRKKYGLWAKQYFKKLNQINHAKQSRG